MAAPAPWQFPNPVRGCVCIVCARLGVVEDQHADSNQVFEAYRLVKVHQDGSTEALDDNEINAFSAQYPKAAEWELPYNQTTWYKTCMKLLEQILRDKWAGPFKAAVDPVALKIPDYYTVIKHPMDLGTVKSRLKNQEYHSPGDFASDVRLVFRNAYVYNKPIHDVWKMAEKLSKTFETELGKLGGGFCL